MSQSVTLERLRRWETPVLPAIVMLVVAASCGGAASPTPMTSPS